MQTIRRIAFLGLLTCPTFLAGKANSSSLLHHDSLVGAPRYPAFHSQEKPKQSGKNPAPAQPESFVNLTVRLLEDEKVEIVRTSEVEGRLVERQSPASEYVYEVTKDGHAYVVGFLPQGGFELRGFPEAGRDSAEKKGETKSTTIMLSIPHTSLDALRHGRVGLRIYRIKTGVELETISIESLHRLVNDRAASVRSELLGPAIARSVKAKPD